MSAPVDVGARIRGLDAVRGVALLGILIANVRQMFLPWDVASFPFPFAGSDRLGWLDWQVFDALIDLKFLTLFSLLFGTGFALQSDRLATRGDAFRGIYLRRVGILALFGVGHALLLYPAEVLLPYATTGLLLLALQRRAADTLLRAGLVLLGAMTLWGYQLGSLGLGSLDPGSLVILGLAALLMALVLFLLWRRHWPTALLSWAVILVAAGLALTLTSAPAPEGEGIVAEYRAARQQFAALGGKDPEAWPAELQVRRQEDFATLVGLHAGQYAQILFYFALLLLWRTLALFMIGAGLFRSGVITRAGSAQWRRVAIVGLGVGLPLSLIATRQYGRALWGLADGRFPEFLHAFSALPLAAGIAGAVFVLHQRERQRWLWVRIEAAGRMALTNYLGQSLVMAALAEPWGLNLYARLSGPALTGLAILVFCALALLSHAWLWRFRMGPLEWLWRCGTYGRWLPN